jgi:hypothetical protein
MSGVKAALNPKINVCAKSGNEVFRLISFIFLKNCLGVNIVGFSAL